MNESDRVLFIRFSAIGDILLITPLLRLFHHHYPHVQIDVLTKKNLASLLQYHPLIRNIIAIPQSPSFAEIKSVANEIRSQEYSRIFDLQKHWRSYLITLLSGAGRTSRYKKYAIRRFFLVHLRLNFYPKRPAPVPRRYFEAFRELPIDWKSQPLELYIPDETKAKIESKWPFDKRELTIAIAPGAGRKTKRWPVDHFIELISLLQDQYGAKIILVGGDRDKHICQEIEGRVAEGLIEWCGQTSLLETAEILKKCDLVITHDTGVMHMAAAAKQRLIAIFGPTVEEFGFFPFMVENRVIEHHNLSCRPCSYHGTDTCPKGHFRCMNEIEPIKVIEAASEFLDSHSKVRQARLIH